MAGAFFAAFLTAYYTFRMIFLIVKPDRHEESHDHHHGPLEPLNMKGPVMLLTIGALITGFFGGQIAHMLNIHAEHHALLDMLPAIAVVAIGVFVAYLDYGRSQAQRTGFISNIGALNTLFVNRWYIDSFYNAVIVRLTLAIAALMHWFETHGLDGNFDRLGLNILRTGTQSTRVQNGLMQLYLAWTIIILGIVALYIGMA